MQSGTPPKSYVAIELKHDEKHKIPALPYVHSTVIPLAHSWLGNDPVREFDCISKSVSAVSTPSSEGTVPVSLLDDSCSDII